MVDIDQRVEVVNMRLDVVRELLEILRVELSEQHSTRLEVWWFEDAYGVRYDVHDENNIKQIIHVRFEVEIDDCWHLQSKISSALLFNRNIAWWWNSCMNWID